MLRDLLKEGGLYTIANLVTKGISLLLIPFYSDYFTTAEYGILALLAISGGLAAALFSFQIYQGVGRFISEKGTSLENQQKIGSTGLLFTIGSYALFIILAILLKGPIIDYLSEEDRILDSTYYFWLATLGLNGVFYTLGVQLRFLRKTKAFTVTSFLHAILNILFILVFALGLDYRIDSIFIAGIIVNPIVIAIQVYILRDYLIPYIGKAELKRLFKFSTPLIPASIAYLVLNFTDRIFIKDLNGSLGDVGVYDMGFKFSAVVSIIIAAFQSALAPIVYEKHSESDTPNELGRIMRLFIGVGSFGILVLACFSYETLYVFTQEEYFGAAILMPLFYLSVLMTGLGMFSPGLHVKQRTELIPVIVITSGLINIGLNFWLIPKYNLFGAALATLISTAFNNFALFFVSQRLYPINYNLQKTLMVFFVFLACYTGGAYLDQFTNFSWFEGISIKILLSGIYLFFLFQIKFISFDQIRKRLIRK